MAPDVPPYFAREDGRKSALVGGANANSVNCSLSSTHADGTEWTSLGVMSSCGEYAVCDTCPSCVVGACTED